MNRTIQPTDKRSRDVLADSITREAQITLTHRFHEGWRQFKSAFVQGGQTGELILVQAPLMDAEDVVGLPPVGSTIGVNFRAGHKKCMFQTVRMPDADNTGRTMAIRWPQDLQQMQRRAYERSLPPSGTIVSVKFFHKAPPDQARARDSRYGELEDLSAGGIRVNASDAAGLTVGHTFECIFAPRGGVAPVCCEVILRHREAAEKGRASLGFQFVGLETSPEGRETLARLGRIAAEYQRANPQPRKPREPELPGDTVA